MAKRVKLSVLFVTFALAVMLAVAGFMFPNSAQASTKDGFKLDGASVRTFEPSGIRFTTEVPEDLKVDGYTFGTLIIPENILDGNALNVDTANVLNVVAEKWQTKEDGKPYVYTAVLGGVVSEGAVTDFPAAQFNTNIVAKSYVKDAEGNVLYYTEEITRSLAEVASKTLASADGIADLDDDQIAYLENVCDSVIGEDFDLVESYTYTDVSAVDVNTLFASENGSEGLTASWEVISGDTVALNADEDGIVTTFTPSKIGETVLKATIGTKSATVTLKNYSAKVDGEFEVYSALSGTTPVANEKTIDLASTGITPSSVALLDGTEEVALTATEDYNVVDNKIVISGNAFGASVYGDDVAVIVNGVNVFTLDTIITKKISTLADLQNFYIYGGILADQTNFDYDGHFVLTNNIVLDGSVAFTKATGFGFQTSGKMGPWDDNSYGFKGIFDGQGYSIKNVYLEGYNANQGGLFGNVHKDGVVKNLGVKVIFRNTRTTWSQSNTGLANWYNGALENCYIEVSGHSDGSTLYGQTYPIANDISHMDSKDVVVKADLSLYKDATTNANKGVAYYCGEWAPYGKDNDYRRSTYDNVYAFVKEPAGKTTHLYYSYYGLEYYVGAPYNFDDTKAIAKYDYDDMLKEQVQFTDNTYWRTVDGQPVFASMLAPEFEVYSGLVEGAPVANDLEIAFDSEVTAVSVEYSATTKDLTAGEFSYDADTDILTIDGDAFGSTIYGDVVITINGTESISYKVITKKISTLADLQSFAIYGGILNDATNYTYDGYFSLTNNIECDPSVAYARADGIAFKKAEQANMNDEMPYGLMGIFDGNGYVINNLYTSSDNDFTTGGIFGNVGRTGIVRNLGVRAILGTASTDGRVSPIAYSLTGTIENCYIDVKAVSGTTGFYGVAIKMPYARVNDVVVSADFSIATADSGFVGQALVKSPSGGRYRHAYFTNVHGFVKESASYAVNLYTEYYANQFWSIATDKGGCGYVPEDHATKYAYDAKIETPITFTSNKYWTTDANGQPIFKMAVAELAAQA